jgi:hypothetical protein
MSNGYSTGVPPDPVPGPMFAGGGGPPQAAPPPLAGRVCGHCATPTDGYFCPRCGSATTEAAPGPTPPWVPAADPSAPWGRVGGISSPWTPPAGADPWTGRVPPDGHRTRNRILTGLVVAILLAAAVAGGVLFYQQRNTARQWRSRDLAEVATADQLKASLAGDQQTINKLNGQVANLDNQISALATAKEKAQDQNTALSQLLSTAGTVSNDLETCVQDTDSFESELVDDINNGTVDSDPSLSTNATNADNVCNSAEQANQQMQQAIAAAGGS